jgi:hypothetical protein
VASSSVHEYWYRYSAVPNPHYLTYFLELLREEINALKCARQRPLGIAALRNRFLGSPAAVRKRKPSLQLVELGTCKQLSDVEKVIHCVCCVCTG